MNTPVKDITPKSSAQRRWFL